MKDYIINEDPIVVPINIDPRDGKQSIVEHKFRRPTFQEEESRERETKIISEETGVKVAEGTSAPNVKIENEKADLKFWEKLILTVNGKGYGLTEETSVDTVLGDKPIRESIPNTHKTTAIYGLMPSNFELDLGEDDDAEYVFALGSAREWTIKQMIGGQDIRDDGTLAPPLYTLHYIMSEPTEADRKKYRLNAMSNSPYIRKGGLRTDVQSVNLKVVSDLFDRLVKQVQGAVVQVPGEPESITVPLDVRNADHLAAIPGNFKKTVVIRLFNALEADLGKSEQA